MRNNGKKPHKTKRGFLTVKNLDKLEKIFNMATKKTKKSKPKKTKLSMDFVLMDAWEAKTTDERIKSILESVKKGHILVLDKALNADEEARLVTATMEGIGSDFSGIEFCSLPQQMNILYRAISRFVETFTRKKFTRPGLTLIGPSTIVREIKRDPNAFHVYAKV